MEDSKEKSGKLHEILAVETDLEGVYKRVLEEARVTFDKKADHFMGSHRTLSLFKETAEGATEGVEDHKEMVTTVHDKLSYVLDHFIRYVDVVLQKERANQEARADIVVDGVTLAKDVPATFLLGLESKLKNIRTMIEVVPTLAPGISWVPDSTRGEHVYRREHPEKKYKTAKTFMHKVLYEATDKHPAQIEKWEENVNVGVYTTESWSDMLSPAEKSLLLKRCDVLIRSVKVARMRANQQAVDPVTVGDALIQYILKG